MLIVKNNEIHQYMSTGGTAVGTGLNSKIGFAEKIAETIEMYSG